MTFLPTDITYTASRCPCGCKNWFVDPPAAIQGVSFTEKQARAVANLLNKMEYDDGPNS